MRNALLFAALWVLTGCAEEDSPFLYEESFEDCPRGACGWQQLGNEGEVRFVTTIHPGEHGIRLAGGASAIIATNSSFRDIRFTQGALEASASAHCDEGARLELAIGLSNGMGRSEEFIGTLSTMPDWRYALTTLVGVHALDPDALVGLSTVVRQVQITGLELRQHGAGSCEVDHLILGEVGSTTRRPGDGED